MKNLYFKKTVRMLLISFLTTGAAFAGNYCNGFEQGYKNGFQNAVGVPGYDVVVPLCPPQPITEFEQQERDYQNGYNRGYSEGQKKGEKKVGQPI